MASDNSRLVIELKDCAKEIVERAVELVGEEDLLTDLDIWIRLYPDGRSIPQIEVSKSYSSRAVVERIRHGD